VVRHTQTTVDTHGIETVISKARLAVINKIQKLH